MRKVSIVLPENFGSEVLKARSTQRFSQAELAARSKVSTRTISEVETGLRKQLTKLVVLKIAMGLERGNPMGMLYWLAFAKIDPGELKRELEGKWGWLRQRKEEI